MRVVERQESAQVLDHGGRIITTYGTKAEADAFVLGYKTATRDGGELFTRRVNETIAELKGRIV